MHSLQAPYNPPEKVAAPLDPLHPSSESTLKTTVLSIKKLGCSMLLLLGKGGSDSKSQTLYIPLYPQYMIPMKPWGRESSPTCGAHRQSRLPREQRACAPVSFEASDAEVFAELGFWSLGAQGLRGRV